MTRVKLLRRGLLGLAVSLVLAFLLSAAIRARQLPPDASGAYNGTDLNSPAADFRLIDQNSVSTALSDFRGQVVALTFMDSRCQETCPIIAIHLRKVNQALGDEVKSVVFMGVNVNLEADTVADVMAATQKWQLDEIPTWHFLTGNAEELEPIWRDYGISVIPDPEGAEIGHTPGVYLIDQNGQTRWYVSTPFDQAGTPQWTAPLSDLLVKHIRELLSERAEADASKQT